MNAYLQIFANSTYVRLAMVLLLVSGCGGGGGGSSGNGNPDNPPPISANFSEYYPLAKGFSSDYRITIPGGGISAVSQTLTNGLTYNNQASVRSCESPLEWEDQGYVNGEVISFAFSDSNGITGTADVPLVLGKDNWQSGQAITTSANVSYGGGSTPIQIRVTFVGIESVTVPAGTFADSMKVNFSVNDGALTGTSWYARNIGLIKEADSAGELWELTSSTTLASSAPSILSVSPSAGASDGGNFITLAGANIQFGATTLVGNKLGASVLVTDPASASAFLPAGNPGTATVGIVNPDCQAAFLEDQFEYRNVWSTVSTSGAPEARTAHKAVWTGSEMIVWGGRDVSSTVLNTGGRFDPSSNTWRAMSTTGAPEARWGHAAVWTGTEMLIWGGFDGNQSLNTGARYNPQTDSWEPIASLSAPMGRVSFPSIWTGSDMIVWGGFTYLPNTATDAGARYSPASDTWTSLSMSNAPAPRGDHSAVWTGTRMIVWGGKESETYLDTGGVYDPVTDSWSATTLSNAPAARAGQIAAWTGSEMLIYAGVNASPTATLAAGGRYDPLLDSWTTMSIQGAPAFYYYAASHPGVWSGNELIVWSWQADGSTGGARYDPDNDSWSVIWTTMHPDTRASHTAVWTGDRVVLWGGEFASAMDTGGIYDPVVDPYLLSEPLPQISGVAPDNGPVAGGTQVSISGSHFRPDVSVTIAGNAGINTTMVDTSTIVTTVPVGFPGYADVVVSIADVPWWRVTGRRAFSYTPFSFEGWIGGGQNGWQYGDGPGSARSGDAEFSAPSGIFVDGVGNMFMADTNNERVQKWDANGNYIGWIGGGVDGWRTGPAPTSGNGDGELQRPSKVAVDAGGNIFVTDPNNNRIQKWSAAGDRLGWIGGGANGWQTGSAPLAGDGDGQFNQPMGVVLDSLGNIYVADKENHRIQKWDVNGVYVGWIGGGIDGWQTGQAPASGNGNGSFVFPMDVAVDSSDNVYIADTWNWRIQKWDRSGVAIGWIGGGLSGWQTGNAPASDSTEFGHFREVFGVSLDSSGNIYAANSGAHSINKWDSSGNSIGWIGNGQYGWQGGSVSGTYGSATGFFAFPWDMAVGPDGKLYIADAYNARIQKWREQ